MATFLGARAGETFGSFRRRDFSLVWVSANIAMAGRQMEIIAVLWLVLELTGDPLLVGLAGGSALGLAFLSVFAGAVVDRMPRRLLMAAGHFIAAALAFLLMALLLSDALKVWMIFAIILGGGAFRTIELPVTNALLIDTVPRERLTNAVAMLGFGQNLTQFVGPIAGGFLYTPLTPAGLFGFIGAMYVIGGLLALMVRTRNATAGSTTPRQILIGVGEGLRHVWQRKELFMALLIAAMYNVTGFPFSTALMPIFAKETLQGGPEVLGLLNGAMGAGAVIGALVVAGIGTLRQQGWWLVWAVNGGWHGSMILFAVAGPDATRIAAVYRSAGGGPGHQGADGNRSLRFAGAGDDGADGELRSGVSRPHGRDARARDPGALPGQRAERVDGDADRRAVDRAVPGHRRVRGGFPVPVFAAITRSIGVPPGLTGDRPDNTIA